MPSRVSHIGADASPSCHQKVSHVPFRASAFSKIGAWLVTRQRPGYRQASEGDEAGSGEGEWPGMGRPSRRERESSGMALSMGPTAIWGVRGVCGGGCHKPTPPPKQIINTARARLVPHVAYYDPHGRPLDQNSLLAHRPCHTPGGGRAARARRHQRRAVPSAGEMARAEKISAAAHDQQGTPRAGRSLSRGGS